MELPKDDRPDTASFTSPRDVTLVSKDGSMCVIFEKGETRSIRKEFFTPAIDAGLVPDEPLTVTAEPIVPENKPHDVTVHEGLIEACKTLIGKGLGEDFTVAGIPRAASVKKLVDFSFTTKQIERAFSEAMHEVEQDGNSSQEHPEQSVSAA